MSSTRLLDIAIREFGAKGLEGASTRGIAAAAGTAMSAITYHYGGKEGLYLAAADRIAALMAERMGAELLAEAAIADPSDADGARDRLIRTLLRMADTMASAETEEWAPFIVREQMHPTAAFERIHAGGMGLMLATIARLVGIATAVDDRSASIAAITLVGQATALRASRAMFLRLLETDSLGGEDFAAIKARIVANTHAILDRLIAERQDLP